MDANKTGGWYNVTLFNVPMSNSGDGPDVSDLNRTVHFCCSGLKNAKTKVNLKELDVDSQRVDYVQGRQAAQDRPQYLLSSQLGQLDTFLLDQIP